MRAMIVLTVGLTATSALAQPVGQTVDAVGCPGPGVERGCVILRTLDGRTYNISSARPTPPFGTTGIRVIGAVSGKISFCMQGGPVLDPVQYTPAPVQCVPAGPQR